MVYFWKIWALVVKVSRVVTSNLLNSRLILAEEIEEAKVDTDKLLADSLGLDIVEFTVSCAFSKNPQAQPRE
jgi:D-ribose pyranose/furanose isomerase RbsD